MQVTKDHILAALPTLSQPDLLAIQMAAGALLQRGVLNRPPAPESPQAWLFVALAGLVNLPPRMPVEGVKGFNKNAPGVISFVTRHFPACLHRKVTALGVMTMLLQLLASDLRGKGIPVTLTTLAHHLPRIAEVFEQAFPGYLASGIAGCVMASPASAL